MVPVHHQAVEMRIDNIISQYNVNMWWDNPLWAELQKDKTLNVL